MAFSRKKTKWGIENILSWKPTLEFLGFPFYSRKFQKKRSFTPETPQNCVTRVHHSELLRPKTKTPGNSIWFFLSWPPLKIPCFFSINPRKLKPQLSPPLSFFRNSSRTDVKVVYILGNFCWYWTCSSPDPKNSRCDHQQQPYVSWIDVSTMSIALFWWSRKFIYFFFFLLIQFCYW